MNDYLVDAHALLWFHEENPLLSAEADAIIRNRSNKLYVPIASLWEISIKINIGKLRLQVITLQDFIQFCFDNDIVILPLQLHVLNTYVTLPLLHRDPFDRILIAQAQTDNFIIITKDDRFKFYNVKTLW